MSEDNTCIAEPNLDVLPFTVQKKNSATSFFENFTKQCNN